MSSDVFTLTSGREAPLGASLDEGGCNFVIYSPNATDVSLCLFDKDEKEICRFPFKCKKGPYWYGYVKGVKAGQLYGYRVSGPNDPSRGLLFDPSKLLIDPYSKALSRHQEWDYKKYSQDDDQDMMSKSVVVDDSFDWQGVEKPVLPEENVILYETHVKGYTKLNHDVPRDLRGTYLGLVQPKVIEHLKQIGITAVELLPCSSYMSEPRLVDLKLSNYWGYNTLCWMAPEPMYAKSDAVTEFKTMVRELHRAGIAVIMDIVFNHTCEGGNGGPLLCYRGFDDAGYYWHDRTKDGSVDYTSYSNFTGCGNSFNADNPAALRLIMDSLRYWSEVVKVDGFRFDLAVTVARGKNGFSQDSGFLRAIGQDPVLSREILIAEPWDVGGFGYRVGQFPPGWHEQNDRYRDTVRSFWKGDRGRMAEFATRILGSRDIYPKNIRSINSSVNFITYHDGFTLTDVVSYNERHNEANLEENRDGTSQNLSYNCGTEGPTADIKINQQREKKKRSMLATLLISQGMPHIVAGDEMGRTQLGNNNAYCQDNRISWVNWHLGSEDRDLVKFVGRVTRLRLSSEVFKSLRLSDDKYLSIKGDSVHQVAWHHPNGNILTDGDWNDPDSKVFLLDIGDPDGKADRFLILFNASSYDISFHLPDPSKGMWWSAVLDSSVPDGDPERDMRIDRSIPMCRSYSVKVIKQIVDERPKLNLPLVESDHPVRVGIDGFSQLGATLLQESLDDPDIQVVGVNDLHDIESLSYLFRKSSSYGMSAAEVPIENGSLVINGKAVRVTDSEKTEKIDWEEIGTDIAVDTTLAVSTPEEASAHLQAGARRVIAVTGHDTGLPAIVLGVNEDSYKGESVIASPTAETVSLIAMLRAISAKFKVSGATVSWSPAPAPEACSDAAEDESPKAAEKAELSESKEAAKETLNAEKAEKAAHLQSADAAGKPDECPIDPAMVAKLLPELAGAVKVVPAESSAKKAGFILDVSFEGDVAFDDLKKALREAAESDGYGTLAYSEAEGGAKPESLSVFEAASSSAADSYTARIAVGCDRMASFARYLLRLVNFIARR